MKYIIVIVASIVIGWQLNSYKIDKIEEVKKTPIEAVKSLFVKYKNWREDSRVESSRNLASIEKYEQLHASYEEPIPQDIEEPILEDELVAEEKEEGKLKKANEKAGNMLNNLKRKYSKCGWTLCK